LAAATALLGVTGQS
jgi:hypothetical protein